MNNFINDIKEYLKAKLNTNDVDDAYLVNTLPKARAIRVYMINASDNVSTDAFDKNYSTRINLQIYGYETQSAKEKKNAITKTYEYIEQIKKLFEKNTIKENNKNIISVRVGNIAPALAVKDGSQLFVSSLRVEFTVNQPYEIIYKGE